MILFLTPFIGKMAILGGALGVSLTLLGVSVILIKYFIAQKKKKK